MVCRYVLLVLLKIEKGKNKCLMTSRCSPVWEIAVYLAVAVDVFDGVLLSVVLFPHEMSWMRSGTEFSQFPRLPLPNAHLIFMKLDQI